MKIPSTVDKKTCKMDNEDIIINEKLETLNRNAIIFERNHNFSKIPSAVDKETSKMDDEDIIINEKLETLI